MTFIFGRSIWPMVKQKKTCVYFFIIDAKMLCKGQGSTTCFFYLSWKLGEKKRNFFWTWKHIVCALSWYTQYRKAFIFASLLLRAIINIFFQVIFPNIITQNFWRVTRWNNFTKLVSILILFTKLVILKWPTKILKGIMH